MRRPVRREHARVAECRRERRQREPAAELEHPGSRERPFGDDGGECNAARPDLGPVGQELLALERLFVEQRLGAPRPQDRKRAPRQLDRLLDEVELPGLVQGYAAGSMF